MNKIDEFATKYCTLGYEIPEDGTMANVELKSNKAKLRADLTALLEQHKEMMLREELIKFGDYFNECVSKTIYTSLIDEYLKNVKK